MADRTVKVVLKADVSAYIRDVEAATVATRALRAEATRFEDTYTAKLRVDTKGAAVGVRQAERDVGRSAGRMRRDLDGLNLSLRNLKIPAIGVGVAGAAPGVASLVASGQQLLGVVGLLPAAALGAGAALGVVVAGLDGFGDAAKKGGAELDKLAPSARAAAVELRSQAAEWRAVQQGIQGALFKGQSEKLDALGRTYIPVVSRASAGLADELGVAARAFEDFALRADSVQDTKDGLELTRQAAARLAPVVTNLSAILRDVSATGARELPSLAAGVEAVTNRWATAVARARATGDLARWMSEGRAEAAQLGRIIGDLGGIMGGLGRASQGAGIDLVASLERGTDAVRRYVYSWEGQAAISSTLAGLKADVDAFVPGLRDLAGMALAFVQHLSGSGTLRAAGDAFSALTASARPTVEVLGQLTGTILRPLLGMVQALAPALGPVIAGMLALRTASAAIGAVQTRLDGLGGRFDNAARAASGNAEATSRVSGALNKVSSSLPLIGAVLVGIGLAYDALRSKADDAAASVLNGSQSLTQAYMQQTEALVAQRSVFEPGVALTALFGTTQDRARVYAESFGQAIGDVTAKQREQIAGMAPLAAAQATVTLRQAELNNAVTAFGISSPQAKAATDALSEASKQLELQQYATSLGVDTATAALIRNRDATLAASNAEIGYFQAVDTATAAVASNGRTLDLHTQQGRANQQALNDLSRAALADVEAKRAQEGQTVAVTLRGREHQDQLYRTALQMGMSRDEARNYVAQLALVPANQETRFLTPGLMDAINGVSELSRLLNSITTANLSRDALTGAVSGARSRLNQIGGRATGGPITGPGSGTSDDVLLWGSNGEWVIRERVTSEQGAGRMAMLNAGRADIVPRGGLPAYAGGGPIAGRPSAYRAVTLDFTGAAAAAKQWKSEMFPPMPAGGWGGGVQRWAPMVLAALARKGQPASLLGTVLRRMNQESGGNSGIVNNWDSNARKGTPSGGLMQTIWPTFVANHEPGTSWNMFDPWANILASMNYAMRRYGSLAAAYNRRGGYHDGGVIPGVREGYVLAQGGERVLTRGQTVAFDRLVEALDRRSLRPVAAVAGRVRGGDGAVAPVINNHYENHFREAVDLDLFNSRQDFAVRSLTF